MPHEQTPASLVGMSTQEIQSLVESLGQPRFRGSQISAWVYKRNARSIPEMSDLPASFREALAGQAALIRPEVVTVSEAPDGTAKFLLQLADGQRIETVLLPYPDRISACVSTQVGCPAACAFCATGIGGFCRNLTAGEIVDQVLTIQRETSCRVSHVVYMGMGEPLMNYDSTLRSIHILSDEVGIAMRHITLSTVGITPRIERLAKEKLQITLAVSLHAPTDAIRRTIIPLAARYPVKGLLSTCKRYADTTHRRVTFEYMLIRGVNDSHALARQLVEVLRGMLCSVNLIPYNPVDGLSFERSTQAQIDAFRGILEQGGISVTQRMERGTSVSAACGQLRRRTPERRPGAGK